ncbi:mercury resistance system transport protein MerF [Mesorhizobium sp.]|uniref:mercury resistance system transport protein MerF n=1 Tax=Mesorhizobium sp. TaxID=1871066 RepID=UPI000FE8C28C|nr:mercury resistance system transport protein MerF [Mesorhizobium sp.]RWM19436.1 MAG: mercury resistance system transport protein MerF [Mesorhizobium sp.]RWM31233.1 MAG: mercury resistance system transport protein MerF [Mesorhizobium sp.]TIO72990.1 MAG: mercury resistance system transport protein MerF [Mesorhizobium sp.]TIO80964.1 MAG: mercury resistance system transport protein MerF [Mesorhizobium sp.]TJV47981.1 MAG: mercury resistance system transport protein MerF [Mesorhizobium sp.]
MSDRVLIRTGIAGAFVTAICCATPVLVTLAPLVGLGTWLIRADWVLFPLLAASLGLIIWGLHRRQTKGLSCAIEVARRSKA